ncbi:hypothetical protein HKCCE3408_09935 [Rhodobacterales bacterium HKCCE3408]|nr:hypothetical protein [Rhodobacterales bacterium HKCCE3408]
MIAFRTLLLLAIGLVAAAPAPAQTPDLDDVVEVRLLPGWRRADGSHMAAIEIRLAPGWKTYWRSPGEGGIPPVLSISGAEARMHWPRPEVFLSAGLRTIGYHDDVIFPIELDLGAGAHPIEGRIDIGVCQDVCLPVSLPISATLQDGGSPDPRIVAALADQPLSADEASAGAATCTIRPISDGMSVEARLPLPSTGGEETVVFEHPDPSIWISGATSSRDGGWLVARADLVPADASPFALNRSDLRITVLGTHDAVEFRGCTAG